MIIEEISEELYNEYANNYKYTSVLQTKEYAKVMINQGYIPMYIGAKVNDRLVSASLILVKKQTGYKYAYSPRGFLIDYSNKELLIEYTKELKKYLLKKDIIAIKICPPIIKDIINNEGKVTGINPSFDNEFNNLIEAGYHHYGFNSLFEGYKPRFEALIDLSVGKDKLFNNIKKNYKTKIRSAEKRGIKVYRAKASEIDLIYEQTRNKYPRDLKYFQDSYNIYSENKKM